jgi:hypothetical protein
MRDGSWARESLMKNRSINGPVHTGRRVLSAAGLVLGLMTGMSTLGCELIQPNRLSAPVQPREPAALLMIVDGEDYTLPTWVGYAPYTGYVDHPQVRGGQGDESIGDGGGQYNRQFWWRELEPEQGVYDWSTIAYRLDQAIAGGYQIQVRILSSTVGRATGEPYPNAVPDWVFTELGVTESDLVDLKGEYNLLLIPAWRPEIRDAFNDMIRAFGAWLSANPVYAAAIGSAYVHGFSYSRGEEFHVNAWDGTLDDLEAAGMTPVALHDWMATRLNAFAEAFGADAHKVAWVGTANSWRRCREPFPQVAVDLVQHALNLGFGIRQGNIERYFQAVNEPAIGQQVDARGYLTVDEMHPLIATTRYFGDENEEYGEAWYGRFGSPDTDQHRYRFSLLVSLQRRYRWLWTGPGAEALNPPLSAYTRASFGKTVDTTPDAWAYLSQTPARPTQSPVGWIKNIERWLLQRDVPGGMTVAVERVDRQFAAGPEDGFNPSTWYDYTARRTDLAEGSPYIYFDLDDRFQISGRALLKVEFRDEGDTSWRVEYMGYDDELKTTPGVQNTADGKIKTATFALDDARFANELPHGMDLRIVSDGPGDVTVRWVRIIRADRI